MLEVERLKFSSFWKTEILGCVVARNVENIKGFRRNVQHKKCSLACLVWIWKFSESLVKYKNGFMLEKFSLSRIPECIYKSKIDHVMHTPLALHSHIERGICRA